MKSRALTIVCVAALVVSSAIVGRAFQALDVGGGDAGGWRAGRSGPPEVAGPEPAAPQQSAQTSDKTVRDKVYSPDQAKGGKTTYDNKCASCHDGGTMGPELWGDSFLTSWEGKTVATFFERIKTTMPEDSPGTLTEAEVIDVIAYVLQTNGFPAGDAAMQNGSAIATMKFVRNK